MPKAVWKDTILAESDETIVVEGNHYFPPDSIRWEHFQASDSTSRCHWKGIASYYHVVVNGETNRNAAWTYRDPSAAASQIKDHLGFWRGVEVQAD